MNPRERRLAIIVGVGVVGAILYYGIDLLFVSPLREANLQFTNLELAEQKLDALIASERGMGESWNAIAGRTFSYQASRAQALFGQNLKDIAKRHHFDLGNFKPRTGSKIGYKTDISTVAYRISVTGQYKQAVDFVRDVYRTPYLCQITGLTISPLGAKSGRNTVKLDFTVETPVLPKIKLKDNLVASQAETMPEESDEPLSPIRTGIHDDDHYLLLAERNILRSFKPAPHVTVMIDNQDIKLVGYMVDFFWEGRLKDHHGDGVNGKQQASVSGEGDSAEVLVTYPDGTLFGPKRLEFAGGNRSASITIPAHTPLPEAETIIVAVKNDDEHEVFVSAIITDKDSKQIKLPDMMIPPGQTIDIPEWEARQIRITARYQSGKPGGMGNFLPRKTKQIHTIPKETAAVVAAPITPVIVNDPPPDASFTVSGTWIYPQSEDIIQELIVTNGTERKVINAGEPAVVDGGMLLAVHPLGGIVKMPTGNYYIYPLGKSFSERVLLDARMDSQLADAIDRWTRQ